MTLYRQLVVIIICIFIAMFVGTFTITVHNSRQYLNNQLQSHAQDTATMLGLSISAHINDKATLDSMVNAVFDRGDYRLIRIENLDNTKLLERTIPVTIEGVPSWFIRFIRLTTPIGESLVMSGWNKTGTVYVESHPGYAYQEAWQNVVGTFIWFVICSVLILVLGLMLLRKVLQPLYAVEQQAESICRKEFVIQNKIPRTRELQRVVTVMNTLSIKVKKMFLAQAEHAEDLRKQLFASSVTGLGNRRYFDSQLNHLIDTPEEFDSGALLIVALQNLHQINREMGYQIGDQVLQKTAGILRKQCQTAGNSILAHISGSEFTVLIPGMQEHEADQIAERMSQALLELQSLGLDEKQASIHIGVAMYQGGQSASEFLACADLALRDTQGKGAGNWYRNPIDVCSTEVMIAGAQKWRAMLQETVKHHRIELHFQPVVTPDGTIMHHEVLARIPDHHGRLIPASVFIPMAERQELSTDLDKMVVSAWLSYIGSNKDQTADYAINLSPNSIQNPDFVHWLSDQLQQHPEFASRLILEVAEYGVSCQVETIRNFIEKLASLNCRFAIDHFGRGFTSFKYLRTVKVSYLKIDGSFIRHIAGDEENQFFVQALTKTAHELEIPVIAEFVETQADKETLLTLHINGLQGFLIGKPSNPI